MEHEYHAALRVVSETLTLAELCASLGEPSEGYDINEPLSRRDPDGAKRPNSRWSLTSQAERTRPLDEHVAQLATFAEDHRDALDALQAHANVDIFCGVLTAGEPPDAFALEPELLRRLFELQVELIFDVY